jgi:hypothetical protein
MRRRKNLLAGLAVAALAATGAGTALVHAGTAPSNGNFAAVEAQKEKNLTAGEKEAKKLLLLMDKDQSGKVSKAEFMSFMDAEFDRMDTDKSGELDVQELTQTRVHSSGAIHR